MAKLTALSEIHRGGETLLQITVEVDIEDAPRYLGGGLDTSGVSTHAIDDVLATAERVAKQRQAERDAHAAKAEREAAEAAAPATPTE